VVWLVLIGANKNNNQSMGNDYMFKLRHSSVRRKSAKALLLSGVSFSMLAVSQGAVAQVSSDPDEVIVTGSRQVIQDSIALKRDNTQIVDGLSADEIGDIPALSIGEALESITGVASHRENGGATEVSIRGLGPYLSSTVVNGRATTNGSGDRSVNFSQFPSELVNKLSVFKTQDASQIEGGVAGQIQIETLKPLDYGKRRIQAEIKGNINPDQLKQDDTLAGDIGYRGTVSYVDQFEVNGLGDIGISIGVQRSDISQPEAEYRSTSNQASSRPACVISNGLPQYIEPTTNGTVTGFSNNPETRRRGDDDCDDVNVEGFDLSDSSGSASPTAAELAGLRGTGSRVEGYDTSINPVTGRAVDFGAPFVFTPSQRHFRQNDTRDEREALFSAVQWEPSDRLELNADVQYSERTQSEQRNDLTFNGWKRNDTSLNIGTGTNTTSLDALVLAPGGGVLRAVTDNRVESQAAEYERNEKYLGGGFGGSYEISDRLSVSADLGYSRTERTEKAIEVTINSSITPVIDFDVRGRTVPQFTLSDEVFDVNDHSNFNNRLRIRVDNDLDRTNTIKSARFDVDYDIDGKFFTNLEAGVRIAEQDYLSLAGGADSRNVFAQSSGRFSVEIERNYDFEINDFEIIDRADSNLNGLEDAYVDVIGIVNSACQSSFPEGNAYLASVRDEDLIRNIDDDGTLISSTNSWATFDPQCVVDTTVNSLNDILPTLNEIFATSSRSDIDGPIGPLSAARPELNRVSTRTTDVSENTKAFYAMTGYETSFDGLPISGNIGLRVVQTDITSTGYRPELSVLTGADGALTLVQGTDLEQFTVEADYTRLLPSAIAIVELADDKLLRLGAFKAMSRADPSDMGVTRRFSSASTGDDDDDPTTLQQLISQVSGDGNPAIGPLMSWNFDAGFEWYPNEDSIFALGAYYKVFQGGFINVFQEETYSLNGEDASFNVEGLQQVSDENSNLFGIEFTGSHRFSYLPGLLSGLGAKVSYNYVDSDFEFEDSNYGDVFAGQEDGSIIQVADGIIAPGGLPGLSKHTLSAQAYYQISDFDFQVNYKYRSDYFQPFTGNGTVLRFVGDVGTWEARASYELNDNLRFQVEAINIFSEPKTQYANLVDDLYEANDYGPRIFFGMRARF